MDSLSTLLDDVSGSMLSFFQAIGKRLSSTSVGARAVDEGLGGPLGSSAYLFIRLTFCGVMTPPHPAGDPKGPPFPASSTLAPTDRPASRLPSRLVGLWGLGPSG